MKTTSLEQKMKMFWMFLTSSDWQSTFGFNDVCHKKAEQLGIDLKIMNALISSWACTLDDKFPEDLLFTWGAAKKVELNVTGVGKICYVAHNI